MTEIDGLIQRDDFVSAVLTQIIDGVKKAQNEIDSDTETINPSNLQQTSNGEYIVDSYYSKSGLALVPQIIEFDIAVTASESAQTEGKVGASIAVLGASTQGTTNVSAGTASRIKFSVPVQLPTQK